MAVTLDESDQLVPIRFGRRLFRARRAASVWLCDPHCGNSDSVTCCRQSIRSASADSSAASLADRPTRLAWPARRRFDDHLDDRLEPDLEQPIEFSHRSGTHRMIALHRSGRLDQLTGFAKHAEPGKPAEQLPKHLLQAANAGDFLRLASFCETNIEERLRDGPRPRTVPSAPRLVPPLHRKRMLRRASNRVPSSAVIARRARSAISPLLFGRRQELFRVVHRQPRADHPFRERFFDAHSVIEFDERFLACRRAWNRLPGDFAGQSGKLPAVLLGSLPPSCKRIADRRLFGARATTEPPRLASTSGPAWSKTPNGRQADLIRPQVRYRWEARRPRGCSPRCRRPCCRDRPSRRRRRDRDCRHHRLRRRHCHPLPKDRRRLRRRRERRSGRCRVPAAAPPKNVSALASRKSKNRWTNAPAAVARLCCLHRRLSGTAAAGALHPHSAICIQRTASAWNECGPFFEPHLIGLTEPMDQQRHRRRQDRVFPTGPRLPTHKPAANRTLRRRAARNLDRRRWPRLGAKRRAHRRLSSPPHNASRPRPTECPRSIRWRIGPTIRRASENRPATGPALGHRGSRRLDARAGPVRRTSAPSIRAAHRRARSGMLFSTAGKRLNWPPKPRMFHGSTIAPHSIPRCNRSSICARQAIPSASRPRSAAR